MTNSQSRIEQSEFIGASLTEISQLPTIISTARAGFREYSQMPIDQRLNFLRKLRYRLVERQDEISDVIAASTGKIKVEALTTEVMVVADAILHLEKRAKKALATTRAKTPITFIGKQSYVEYKARGVVAIISPWNFPFMLAMVPAVEALAAGNALIIKPSEETPPVGMLIESLFQEIGMPPGVVQVLYGGGDLGEALVRSSPDFVHFTGAVNTGRAISAVTGPELIPTTLELGGKDPMIVFEDANIKRAVNGAIWGAFANSGQVCMSVERLYVHNSIFDSFLDLLVQETSKLNVGNDANDDIGTMTIHRQVELVKRHVKAALDDGAKLLTGDHPDTWEEGSLKLQPMILTNVKQDMAVMQEETFGPVLPVMRFDSTEEAIELANDSRFGLTSSVWTQDLARGKRVISRMRTAGALLNDVLLTIGNPYLPYGGNKESGVGYEHADLGVQNFSLQTAVMVDRGRKLREVNWFPYLGKEELFQDLLQSYWSSTRNFGIFGLSYLRLLRKGRKG
ncbi:MAG: aldehyde dehydrogenase family protein [Actinomycetota bacterium]|nr:MAG: aldehyde dehydrogenase family protein [Actinomycetota bacterium]